MRFIDPNNFDSTLNNLNDEKLRKVIKDTISGVIPTDIPNMSIERGFLNPNIDMADYWDKCEEYLFFKEVYNYYCGYCFVNDLWVSELAKLLEGKKCIEIMAGQGLLSYALQKHGVDIVAYDNFSWDHQRQYTAVYNMDAVDAAEKLTYDYIICSWPPYEDTTICDVVKKMYYKNKDAKLIYIGEDLGGCTGCIKFFDIVQRVDSDIIDRANSKYMNFYGIHDFILLCKPNHKAKNIIKNKNVK